MNAFKLLNISSLHSGYLKSFYCRNSDISGTPYDDHHRMLMNDTTEFAASYTRNFRKLGVDANCIIANDAALQAKWASARNITTGSATDIIDDQVRYFKPDILWLEDLNPVTAGWIGNIRARHPFIRQVIAYHCAPYNQLTLNKLKKADYVVTCTPGLKEDLEKEGIRSYLVYHGFDSDLLERINRDSGEPSVPIVFSGSLITGSRFHNSRIALIERILKERIDLGLYVTLEKGYRLRAKQLIRFLYIVSWALNLEGIAARIPFFEYGKMPVKGYSAAIVASNHPPLYGIDMYNLFSRSGIVLNMHGGIAGEYAGNIRMFEVTGVGSCLLTDNKKNMPELFEAGREVVVYDDEEDCIRKIRWLLENEDERKRIAQAGRLRTLGSHTVLERCRNILRIIENEIGNYEKTQ